MDDLDALESLAHAMGVLTAYTDGLGRHRDVAPETLVRVCAALGAPLARPEEAPQALQAHRERLRVDRLPPVVVAWDGRLGPVRLPENGPVVRAAVRLEDGGVRPVDLGPAGVGAEEPLPHGYHALVVEWAGGSGTATVISAPTRAWRRPGEHRSWGVGTHLAALRSARSRAVGDVRDLARLCRWIGVQGGDLVTVLPLLPTFNTEPAEPSPYAPVSRLFWSELVLDLGEGHRPTAPPSLLDVRRADTEVRAALARTPAPATADDPELLRYARFRGAQARLGRDWRRWPASARKGELNPDHVDADEERFHLVAQLQVRRQLANLERTLTTGGVRLGLDLAVGVHPDGYDTWSRSHLFVEGMSVGAPPDPGFPSGQDWGFPPVLPEASRQEGHRYLAASIAHQASLAGVLRVDHVMSLSRLYWIPAGFGLHEGTYVRYPAEELFAVLTLESHRNRCEIVGENLGVVPPDVREGLPRHGIRGIHLAEFAVEPEGVRLPTADEVALIGTHDTPTLAGWVEGRDIRERVRCGLLEEALAPAEQAERDVSVRRLAEALGVSHDDTPALLSALLAWLGGSASALVIPWLEDLWLEPEQVNLPGTRSSERPNWQRPMARLLDDVVADEDVGARLRVLAEARGRAPEGA